MPVWVSRAVIVVAGLGGWFWTQALIARRGFPEGRIGDRVHEVVLQSLLSNRRRKRAEAFAEFDLGVNYFAHILSAWVSKDTAIAKGTSTPLHASLKPADDPPLPE